MVSPAAPLHNEKEGGRRAPRAWRAPLPHAPAMAQNPRWLPRQCKTLHAPSPLLPLPETSARLGHRGHLRRHPRPTRLRGAAAAAAASPPSPPGEPAAGGKYVGGRDRGVPGGRPSAPPPRPHTRSGAMEVPAGQDGIQRLLGAEQEAQAIVTAARKGAQRRAWRVGARGACTRTRVAPPGGWCAGASWWSAGGNQLQAPLPRVARSRAPPPTPARPHARTHARPPPLQPRPTG